MARIWKTKALAKALDEADVYEEDGRQWQSVFLGTVFNLTPSGKYYTPFAYNNVEVCPQCAAAIEGPCDLDSPCWGNKRDAHGRFRQCCEVCRDARWREQAEVELAEIDAFLDPCEGDPCDLFAVREVPEV